MNASYFSPTALTQSPIGMLLGHILEARAKRERLKSGAGGQGTNDIINKAIGLGGMVPILPPGTGLALGAGKGLVQQLQGRTFNQNHMSLGGKLVHGPSAGEQIVDYLGHGIHRLTHRKDLSVPPNSQAMNSGMLGGFPVPMPLSDFMVRPRAKPAPMPTPAPPQRPRIVLPPGLSNEEILRRLRQRQEQLWGTVAPTS